MYVLTPGANFRVFVHVTSLLACGSCRVSLLPAVRNKAKFTRGNGYGKAAVF